MTSRAGFLVLATALAGGATVAAAKPADGANACAYEETRAISFSSWDAADAATVRVIGEDCRDAVVVVSIATADGYGIFAHASLLHALTAEPADELTARDAADVASRVWRRLGPRRTSDLQPWREAQESYDLGDEIPLLSADAYEAARAADQPVVCVASYYEGSDCFWRAPSGSSQNLLRLSD